MVGDWSWDGLGARGHRSWSGSGAGQEPEFVGVHLEPEFMGSFWDFGVIEATWAHRSQLKVGWVGSLGLWDLACRCRPGAGVHGEVGCSLFSPSPTERMSLFL